MKTASVNKSEWIAQVTGCWENRDVAGAASLFANCENYREHPFAENAALSKSGIKTLWNEILQQSDIQIEANIEVETETTACVSYSAKYIWEKEKHFSKGVWIVKFKGANCVSFEQFFMSRDSSLD